MIAVSVVCADTDEEAERQAAPMQLAFLRLAGGRPGPFPSPEEAEGHVFTAAERQLVASRRAGQIVGGPATVRAGLEALAEATAANELMITTMVHGHADRLHSYELVAEVMAEASVAD